MVLLLLLLVLVLVVPFGCVQSLRQCGRLAVAGRVGARVDATESCEGRGRSSSCCATID